jgi:aspartate-semialdehyde dehydrogenase
MDILDNVVPYIAGEEEKMEAELLKLLGKLDGHQVTPLPARMSASCNRVPVLDGHMVSLSIKLRKSASREEILASWAAFRPLHGRGLPTAPDQPIEWAPEEDRPQPRLDRNRGRGMAVTTGRLRPCGLLDWKFTVLSHNTVRGAAGATILNAELLHSLDKLPK